MVNDEYKVDEENKDLALVKSTVNNDLKLYELTVEEKTPYKNRMLILNYHSTDEANKAIQTHFVEKTIELNADVNFDNK
ncbi:UNVERIFIED_CONTAM: hypothetical protein O8I53_11885 [Campylobacter lari]